MSTFDGAGSVLWESNELPVCGVDSPVFRECGVAPERADGVLFAISGDASVGIESRRVIGKLNGYGPDILVPFGEGRSNLKQKCKAEEAGISHFE